MSKPQDSLYKFLNTNINIFSKKQEYFFKQFSGKLFIYFYLAIIIMSLFGIIFRSNDMDDQQVAYTRNEAIKQNVNWISRSPLILLILPVVYALAVKKAKKNTKEKFK